MGKNPFKTMYKGVNFSKKGKMHRPEGAGNFDNMDDYNIVDSVDINSGTIQNTPTADKHIANKKYVDDNIVDTFLGLTDTPSSFTADKWLKVNAGGTALIETAEPTGAPTIYDAVVAPSGGDYTTIQAAIDAGAVTIYVRSGTYVTNADIVLPDGCVLIGEDKKTTIIDFNSQAYQMKATGTWNPDEFQNIRIENLTFYRSTDTSGALRFHFTQNCSVRNCIFKSNTDLGCYISYSDYPIVEGCYFEGHTGDYALKVETISLATYGGCAKIMGNTFYNNKYHCYCAMEHSVISNNSFTRNTSTYVLRISGRHIVVANNTFHRLTNHAIRFESSTDRCTITGNTFYYCYNGVYIISGAVNNIISDNIFDHCTGIAVVNYSDYNLITDNNFYDCANGIQCLVDADNNEMINNKFQSTTPTILIGANCDNNIIIDQDLSEISDSGTGTTIMTLEGNLLYTSGAIASGTKIITASTDALDVAGVNTVFINPSAAVVIGGFANGVTGQRVDVIVVDADQNVTMEDEEATGTQKLRMHQSADETLASERGGWSFVFDGTYWYDVSHARHV